jgi:small-conductance mechanosensitive channel/CRP-like cAMP-binding protein
VEHPLINELQGGIPAIVALVPAIALIRFVCGHLGLKRLRLALSLVALAVSLAVFERLAPGIAAPFRPYLWVIRTFAGIYLVFKLAEVLLLDVFWRRRGQAQPAGIFRDTLSTIFASVVLVILLQAGLNVHVAALVITSAALSIFLGLALQQTVSDLFAGIALVLERPFEPGDWVRVGDRVGLVEEISWRAVRIRLLRLDDYLIVPNSAIAKGDIVNMSSPTRVHGNTIEVGVAYEHPPNLVREVMVTSALDVPGVLRQPAPLAEVLRFDASSIAYRLTYWIDDFPTSLDIESEVRAHLWYAFQRAGIRIPFPILHAYTRPLGEVETGQAAMRQERVAGLLRRVDFLAALKPEQLDELATRALVALYPAGAMVTRKGDAGDSLFIVASGRLEVLGAPPGGGAPCPVGSRDVGDYFGEMALLTGEPRLFDVRAAVDAELVVLTRDVIRPILIADTSVAERLSEALTRHRAGSQQAMERLADRRPAAADQTSTLLGNIRRAFGL